jgi:hypothetical protein
MSRRDNTTPVARGVPFDNTDTNFQSEDVQNALEEAVTLAEGKPRAFVAFWDWNTFPIYLYLFGQTRSNEVPFPVASDSILREMSCSGDQNNVDANAMFALYMTDGQEPTNFGTLASATNQQVTYEEGDLPYVGTTRVSIELVNNGASLPLTFSEDLNTRTVTIQLATNGGGTPTTTRDQLRSAFRLNTDITLIYAINYTGGGSTVLNPASFQCSGGDPGEAIGTVFMRATNVGFREGYSVLIPQGKALIGRVFDQDRGSFSPSGMISFLSFGTSSTSTSTAQIPPYNDTFQAYDTNGGLALTGTFQTINFNNVDIQDGSYSYSSGELTLNEQGLYEIEVDVTTDIVSGTSRSESEVRLQTNTGSGWVDVPALRKIYNRTSGQGATTASINIKRNFNSGDQLRVVVRRESGAASIETLADGSSFSAMFIKRT